MLPQLGAAWCDPGSTLQDKKSSKDAKKQQKKLLKEAKALVAAQGMDMLGLLASMSIIERN